MASIRKRPLKNRMVSYTAQITRCAATYHESRKFGKRKTAKADLDAIKAGRRLQKRNNRRRRSVVARGNGDERAERTHSRLNLRARAEPGVLRQLQVRHVSHRHDLENIVFRNALPPDAHAGKGFHCIRSARPKASSGTWQSVKTPHGATRCA